MGPSKTWEVWISLQSSNEVSPDRDINLQQNLRGKNSFLCNILIFLEKSDSAQKAGEWWWGVGGWGVGGGGFGRVEQPFFV